MDEKDKKKEEEEPPSFDGFEKKEVVSRIKTNAIVQILYTLFTIIWVCTMCTIRKLVRNFYGGEQNEVQAHTFSPIPKNLHYPSSLPAALSLLLVFGYISTLSHSIFSARGKETSATLS